MKSLSALLSLEVESFRSMSINLNKHAFSNERDILLRRVKIGFGEFEIKGFFKYIKHKNSTNSTIRYTFKCCVKIVCGG